MVICVCVCVCVCVYNHVYMVIYIHIHIAGRKVIVAYLLTEEGSWFRVQGSEFRV